MMLLPGDWLQSIQSWATQKSDIQKVFLFGSFARREQCELSDLDLAVIIEPKAGEDDALVIWMFNHNDWADELQAMIPVKLDLQLGNPELSSEIVGPAVAAYGVLLYEKAG